MKTANQSYLKWQSQGEFQAASDAACLHITTGKSPVGWDCRFAGENYY